MRNNLGDGRLYTNYALIPGCELSQRVEKNAVVDGAVADVEHRTKGVPECGLEFAQIVGLDPLGGRWRSFLESFDAFLGDGDLQNAATVQRNVYASALGEVLDIRWIPITRGDGEIVCWASRLFDGRCEHTRGGG